MPRKTKPAAPASLKKSLPSRSLHASLTESYVSRIKPAAGTIVDHYDTRMPNLSLRSTPPSKVYRNGRLAWRFGFRYAGKAGIITIGHWPEWTAAAALTKARKLQVSIDDGLDPREAKRSRLELAAAAVAPIDLVSEMWLRYQSKLDEGSNRHRLAVTSYFTRFVLPAWADRDVHSLTRREIVDLLDGVKAKSGPVAANRATTALSAWFNFLVAIGVLGASPATKLPKTAEAPRARSLSVAELVLVWRAADRIGGPAGRGVQLLISTATRRDEAYRLPRAEVDTDKREWLLPADRNKSKRDFLIPLSPLAMGVLSSCPDTGPYVFSSTGRRPTSGYAHIKERLDAAIAELQGPGQAPLADWTFHDIRRGVRSALPMLKVDRDIAEKILNHAATKLERTYDRHSYAMEKREALELWSDHFTAALVEADQAGATPEEVREAAE